MFFNKFNENLLYYFKILYSIDVFIFPFSSNVFALFKNEESFVCFAKNLKIKVINETIKVLFCNKFIAN